MRIGVVAPARRVDEDQMARTQGYAALTYPAVDLVVHPQCFLDVGHFAGTDEQRAAAFLEFANDPGFDAIWFARGGYGSNRILDMVMPQLNRAAAAKSYLGFSDMGFLLGALYARRIGRPIHGPMAAQVGKAGGTNSAARALAWLVNRDRTMLAPELDGRPTVAFNLVILCTLIGTPWLPDLTDHVVIVEEVGEDLYRIDRLFFQLSAATQLKGIAGIRLGAVTDRHPDDTGFGETEEQIVTRWAKAMGVPYLGRAHVGHYADNMVVPFGVV
jgi:muramoyltetrapeptide carboxypeptidase